VDPGRREILRRVRAFTDLGDEECDAVLAVLKARRGAPGDVLFNEGDRGDTLLIVLDGHLVARVRGASGTDEEVARLGPGEVVGEMAFVDAEPRSASVSAPAGATVLEFSRAALASLRTTAPRVAAAIQRNVLFDVARRLRDAGEKLTDGASGSPPKSTRGAGPESMRRSGRGLTVAQLRSIPALASYTAEDLELLAYIALLRTFAAGEVVMKEGTEGDACWLLLSGGVAVTRSTQSVPIASLGPGALVGQLALLDRAPRSATVTATAETAALEVRADAFTNLVRASSPIALRFQDQVALAGVRQLRAATKQLKDNAARESLAPMSGGRMLDVDDWDDDAGPSLELAVDPRTLRR
jgi:CRP/FNR family transcriptional regulator, cyclic AMP receptor protein